MARLLPYANTHILINPFYRRNSSRDVLLATLMEAKDKGLLGGLRRLVFLHTAWSYSPVEYLILCPGLEKQIISIPARPAGHDYTDDDIRHMAAVLLMTPADTFYANMLTPGGASRSCLEGKHDPVAGLSVPLPENIKLK
jgi:hypothetical protein